MDKLQAWLNEMLPQSRQQLAFFGNLVSALQPSLSVASRASIEHIKSKLKHQTWPTLGGV